MCSSSKAISAAAMSFLDDEAVEAGGDYSPEIPIASTTRSRKRILSSSSSESEGGEDIEQAAASGLLTAERDEMASQLQETNKLLLNLTERLKKTEKRMKTMEKKMATPGSTPKSSRTKDVPQEVRVS